MKDKLIIIATIQFYIENMKNLLIDSGHSKLSEEKAGVTKALGLCMFNMYYAITGHMWQGTPKDLMDWLIQYMKDEADKLEGTSNRVTLN